MSAVRCEQELTILALPAVPIVQAGADLGALLCASLEHAGIVPQSGRDVIVVTSKVISRAENRFVALQSVDPSAEAKRLAEVTDKDPRLVELMLRESSAVSRAVKGVLIVRHRLGFISANAGIDESNSRRASDAGERVVLLLPHDPDASAQAIRAVVRERFAADIGVVVTDSHGRPFRLGTVGVAIGVAGLPALWDQRGGEDLHGRVLEATLTATADQIAAAADLVAGQSNEGRPFVLLRGLRYEPIDGASASALLRTPEQDLYA